LTDVIVRNTKRLSALTQVSSVLPHREGIRGNTIVETLAFLGCVKKKKSRERESIAQMVSEISGVTQ
jgi:hypothetical protein